MGCWKTICCGLIVSYVIYRNKIGDFLPSENIQHIHPKNIWEADKRNKLRSVFHGCFTFDLRAAYLFVIARVVRSFLLGIFWLDSHGRWSMSVHFLLACIKFWNIFFLYLCHRRKYSYAVIDSPFYSLHLPSRLPALTLTILFLLLISLALCYLSPSFSPLSSSFLSPPLLRRFFARFKCKYTQLSVGCHVLFLFFIKFFCVSSFFIIFYLVTAICQLFNGQEISPDLGNFNSTT